MKDHILNKCPKCLHSFISTDIEANKEKCLNCCHSWLIDETCKDLIRKLKSRPLEGLVIKGKND